MLAQKAVVRRLLKSAKMSKVHDSMRRIFNEFSCFLAVHHAPFPYLHLDDTGIRLGQSAADTAKGIASAAAPQFIHEAHHDAGTA